MAGLSRGSRRQTGSGAGFSLLKDCITPRDLVIIRADKLSRGVHPSSVASAEQALRRMNQI